MGNYSRSLYEIITYSCPNINATLIDLYVILHVDYSGIGEKTSFLLSKVL